MAIHTIESITVQPKKRTETGPIGCIPAENAFQPSKQLIHPKGNVPKTQFE